VSPGLCIVHEISPGHESVVTETFTLSWLLEQLAVGDLDGDFVGDEVFGEAVGDEVFGEAVGGAVGGFGVLH
jgi:hypothetical protein